MPEPIRYHLDEQMDPDIAVALRRAGIDVTTSLDQGLHLFSSNGFPENPFLQSDVW